MSAGEASDIARDSDFEDDANEVELAAVHASTDGNYAAMLCATHSPAPAQGARRQLSTPPPTAYLHTTPTLLVAQCIVLLLMTIFLGGFCCLFSLQTPKKFADAPPGQN